MIYRFTEDPLSIIADAMPPHRIGFCKPDSGAAIGTPLWESFQHSGLRGTYFFKL